MVVAVETVAVRYDDIVAATPIAVNFPAYREADVFVYYGKASLEAVRGVDYTVTLDLEFNTFEVTPQASLLTKINALIALDATEENFVTIRRELELTTDATAAGTRDTQFTSDEFDRTAMRFQQTAERLNRAVVLAPTFVGDAPKLELDTVAPDAVLMFSADGSSIVAGPDGDEIANAQAYALASAASAAERFSSRAEAETWRLTNGVVTGRTYSFAGQNLRGSVGASVLAGLPGFLPPQLIATSEMLGVVVGAVSDAVALVNAQRINAWLAHADCATYDMGADLVYVGENIRLGRNGNAVIGLPAQHVFTHAASGARLRWSGAVGGTVVSVVPTLTTVDINSPRVYGVSIDCNATARLGLVVGGVYKPYVGWIHVGNMENNAAAYCVVVRDNPLSTGTQVDCTYGGLFEQITMTAGAGSAANGMLVTGEPSAPGRAVTFCQFTYCHFTGANGYSFVFQKGDDNTFIQCAASRAAGGTNCNVLFNTDAAFLNHWVGNRMLNCNLSKSDGAAIQIIVQSDDCRGNIIEFNGVDFKPTLAFNNGAKEGDNEWGFLGKSNYAGGWTDRPYRVFYFRNANVDDPYVMDWYEEFDILTPTITFGGSAAGQLYTSRFINATRKGDRIDFNGSIQFSGAAGAKGSGTGAAMLTGLPYAAAAVGGVFTMSYWSNLASAWDVVGTPSAPMNLWKKGGTTAVQLTHADFTDSTRIDFGGHYQVA